ncbi:hypothetical protein BGZ58_010178 [Dissophora ornata]|nr:hypothetical protein BGZ58_010178 [Dissophora ornata]
MTTPVHPDLLELCRQQPVHDISMMTDRVVKICQEQYRNFTAEDFSFILMMVQDFSASQQQFWESMATLIRYSNLHLKHIYMADIQEWQRTMAYAMLEVFWRQDQSLFLEQIDRARLHETSNSGPGQMGSDAEILSHTMIESLFRTYYEKRALELYEILNERGISMPGRLLESFVRVAVSRGDGLQLERIGNMLLRQEELYQESLTSASTNENTRNRPLMMPVMLMDSFIRGACECELYELARAVFDRGLEAGQKYRASTFTMILNSYSVKDFGFDIVVAASMADTRSWRSQRPRRERNRRESGAQAMFDKLEDGNDVIGDDHNVSSSRPTARTIAVANPEEIEKYVLVMEEQDIKPSIMTLNVLVKLYLEMTQYKVPNAPAWKSAFRRYNPLRLEPDLVTNNTLLAYYEKHKDLTTMKKIYDGMAGTLDGGFIRKSRTGAQRRIRQAEQIQENENEPIVLESLDNQSQNEEDLSDEHAEQPKKRRQGQQREHQEQVQERLSPRRHIRANRDIYTYNTMLHALLQHAVESKDIDSIGQCFQDMELDGISADTVTFNTNILYHISRGDLTAAVQVFRSMEGPARKSPVFNVAMGDRWATDSAISGSSSMRFDKSPSKPRRSIPSFVSTASLSRPQTVSLAPRTESKSKDHSHVQDPAGPSPVLSEATVSSSNSPPVPDVVTLTSLISGFGQLGQMDRTTLFFKEMTDQYRIEPNFKTYSTLVAGLHHAGDHERAERLWDIVLEEDEMRNQSASSNGELADNSNTLDANGITKGGSDMGKDPEMLNVEKAERLQCQKQSEGQMGRLLTIMERRQLEARRKMYKDSLED